MARTDTLPHYLEDIATAIKTKKGDDTPIVASDFDTEIANLPSGGSGAEEFFDLEKTTTPTSYSSGTCGTTWRTLMKKMVIPKNYKASGATSAQNLFYGLKASEIVNLDTFTLDTNVTSTAQMFRDCENIETIDISHLDFSKITDINSMFAGCYKLKNLTLPSAFPSSKTTAMNNLFQDCRELEAIDTTTWVQSLNTNLTYMFNACYKLSDLKLSNYISTSNTTDFGGFISNCRVLKNIDCSNIGSTQNVTSLQNFAQNCYELEEADLSGFVTNKVTKMSSMFYGDTKVKKIDMRNIEFGTSPVMAHCFRDCTALEELHIDKLDLNILTLSNYNSMFYRTGLNAENPTKIYVKNQAVRDFILGLNNSHRNPNWTEDNIIIAGSEQDDRGE